MDGGCSEPCMKYKYVDSEGKNANVTRLWRRALWKSCADRTGASIPPYALQLLWVIATVEQQVGSKELK